MESGIEIIAYSVFTIAFPNSGSVNSVAKFSNPIKVADVKLSVYSWVKLKYNEITSGTKLNTKKPIIGNPHIK